MNKLRLYEIYIASTLHFNDNMSYDIFKYNAKTRVSENSFLKRNDKYFFEKYSKKFSLEDDAILFFGINLFKDNNYILRMSEDPVNEFLSYKNSLHYKFESQVKSLTSFEISDILNNIISPEFIIIYDYCSNGALLKQLDMTGDLLWERYKKKLLKYYPYVVKYMDLSQHKKDLISIILANK